MADDDLISALLSGLGAGGDAPRSTGTSDFNLFNQTSRANNDFLNMAAPVLGAKFDTRSWSPGESLAVNSGKAFLGSILGAIGQRDQENQLNSITNILPQLYADPVHTQLPAGADPTGFANIKMNAIKEASKRQFAQDEQEKQTKAAILRELFSKRPDLAIKALKIDDPAATAPIEEMPETLTDYGPKLGVPSVDEITNSVFKRKRAMGVPATQAEVSARDAAEALRKRSRLLIDPVLKDEAEKISGIEKLVSKGEQGLAKAGETGRWGASGYEKLVSAWAPWRTPEADRQVAGDQDLEDTKNLSVAINKITGTGALSDMESRVLFGSGMGSDKPRAANEELLQNYKTGLAAAKEHNSFLSYFADKTGGNPEQAQQLWELYKKDNPVVVIDKNGDSTINTKRTPWQQFDFPGAYKDYISGTTASSGEKIKVDEGTETEEQRFQRYKEEHKTRLRAARK